MMVRDPKVAGRWGGDDILHEGLKLCQGRSRELSKWALISQVGNILKVDRLFFGEIRSNCKGTRGACNFEKPSCELFTKIKDPVVMSQVCPMI